MKIRTTALPLALLGALALVACNNGSSSPTEPVAKALTATGAPATTAATATAEDGPRGGRVRAAREAAATGETAATGVAVAEQSGHGNGGNGNGNGNGHGHGNGGHGNPGSGDATLQIQPDAWNLNYANANGTVSALVRGIDVSKLDKSSIELIVGSGAPIDPTRVQTSGGQLRAFFAMRDVIKAAGDNVARGDVLTVTLNFTVDGAAQSLTDTVRIVGGGNGGDDGDDDGNQSGDVTLNLHPRGWCDTAGTVTAMLIGDVGKIDLTTIQLVGDNGTAISPTAPPTRKKNSVTANFSRLAAFATLDGTAVGSKHTIKINYTDDGTAKTETARINVDNGCGGDD